MHVVLLGPNGQLGRLVERSTPPGVKLSAFSSAVCDLSNPASLARVFDKTRPDLVINAGAYTQVDKAESEPERAYAVNHAGIEHLIAATTPTTRLLHVSTDFVFDGFASTPYATDAPTNPLGVYGASKLAGEQALLSLAPQRSCIVRTAWLYAAEGRNFFNTMLQLMHSKPLLRVVADQHGTPTSAHGLAEVLWRFAAAPALTGVYHWTDQGEASWYDFACAIQEGALARGLLAQAIPIEPIATIDYPTPAVRPAYSVLDKRRTYAALGYQGESWQQALNTVLDLRQALDRTSS
ncbi:MAG TPA: dTDP-4-dehydrorhamnose reductase [Hyphomicrobiales bacterium]|nr:dTDP-4-dehydrorhamnose reductase [Hyphomicrobiales bacterium]